VSRRKHRHLHHYRHPSRSRTSKRRIDWSSIAALSCRRRRVAAGRFSFDFYSEKAGVTGFWSSLVVGPGSAGMPPAPRCTSGYEVRRRAAAIGPAWTSSALQSRRAERSLRDIKSAGAGAVVSYSVMYISHPNCRDTESRSQCVECKRVFAGVSRSRSIRCWRPVDLRRDRFQPALQPLSNVTSHDVMLTCIDLRCADR